MYKLRILVTPREIFCFSKVGKCLATNSMAQGPVSHAEYCMVSSIVAKAALSTVLKEGEWIKHWMFEQPEKTTGCSCIWFSKGSFVCKMWQNKARKYWILLEYWILLWLIYFFTVFGEKLFALVQFCVKNFFVYELVFPSYILLSRLNIILILPTPSCSSSRWSSPGQKISCPPSIWKGVILSFFSQLF